MTNPPDDHLHRQRVSTSRYKVSRERGKPNAVESDDSDRAGYDPRKELWARYWKLCDAKYSLSPERRPKTHNEVLDHVRAIWAAEERMELLKKISDPATMNPPKQEKRKPLTYILEHSELEHKILALRKEGVSSTAISELIGTHVAKRHAVYQVLRRHGVESRAYGVAAKHAKMQ